MEAFIVYFLKSSGVILLFLTCYKFFLRGETFYTGNRYFLLSGLLLALVLPLISFTKTVWIDIPTLDLLPLVESNAQETVNEVTAIEVSSILFIVYMLGILYGTIRLLLQLLSLKKVFGNSIKVEEGKFKVFESKKPIQPFSFFEHIVYHPESHSQEDAKAILAHEKSHSSQYHSLDILLVHLFSIFQWCNPFIYLYKFYLKENLEFVADANTITTIRKENYQYLLVKRSAGEKHLDFVNPFFNSSVKKRIIMLNKKKSKKRNSLKYGLMLPLLVGFILLFNVETVAKIRAASPPAISTNQIQDSIVPTIYSISKETTDGEIESFKKKIKNWKGELSIENLKRNSEGMIIAMTLINKVSDAGYSTRNLNNENGIEPIFFGQNNKGGLSISSSKEKLANLRKGIIPKIKKIDFDKADVYSIHKNTSDKEIRQIKSAIEKKGRKFTYTHDRNSKGEIIDLELEIKIQTGGSGWFKSEPPFDRCYFGFFDDSGVFIADDEKSFNELKEKNAKGSKGLGYNLKENKNDKFNEVVYDKEKSGDFPHGIGLNYRYSGPLQLVNGVEAYPYFISTISRENIESINVFKGEAAVAIYGEKGKNGVIAITTKGSVYPYLNGLKPFNSVFNYTGNPETLKTLQPQLNGSLKVPDLSRGDSEESPWKVSAGLSPKNQDKMSALELVTYYQKQQGENFQQDLDKALIMVDGKEMSKKDFDKIPINEIESMSALRGESAAKKYGKKGKNGVIEAKLEKRAVTIGGVDRSPMIIIDGKESTNDELESIDRDKIKSISVLKKDQAIKKYGEKAKDGAVEIILKKE